MDAFDDDGNGLTAEEFIEYVKPYITAPANFHKLDFSFGIIIEFMVLGWGRPPIKPDPSIVGEAPTDISNEVRLLRQPCSPA